MCHTLSWALERQQRTRPSPCTQEAPILVGQKEPPQNKNWVKVTVCHVVIITVRKIQQRREIGNIWMGVV